MITWPRDSPLPALPLREDIAEQFAIDEIVLSSGDHAHQRALAHGLARRAVRMVEHCVNQMDRGKLVVHIPGEGALTFTPGALVMVAPPTLGLEMRDDKRWVRCCVRLAVAP